MLSISEDDHIDNLAMYHRGKGHKRPWSYWILDATIDCPGIQKPMIQSRTRQAIPESRSLKTSVNGIMVIMKV